MQTISDKFYRAIRTGGRRKTVIYVMESFGSTYIFEDVPILDGTLNVDRNSDVRRSGTIKIGEKSLTDVFFNNHAGPFGMEIELYHGVVYPSGDEELVKMGVFNIEGFTWQEGDGGWPVVQIYDRAKWIHRAPFVAARDFSGKLAQDVIEEVVAEVIPSATIDFEVGLSNPRLPGGSTFDSSRWEVIKACAEAMGAEAYFDHDGVLQIIEVRDPTATAVSAVWEFNVGEGFSEIQEVESGGEALISRPDGVLISASRSVGREQTYNGVIVYGAAPSSTLGQPYALAFDNDPASPTYYNGPFGKAIKRIDNQLLTTTEQCTDASVAALKNSLGLARSIEFTAIGNPALDAGDYVLFTFSNGSQEVHLLDSYSYPLGPGDFSGTTRTNPTRQTSSVSVEKGTSSIDVKPGPPGKPEVIGVGVDNLTIRWSASKPGSAFIKTYEVYFNSTLKKIVASTILSANITGLSAGTTYTIRIKAVDESGLESTLSDSTQQKTNGTPSGGGGDTTTTYSKSYVANWSRTYTGAGNAATWHGSDCYQGYVDGGNGNYRSLIGFDDERIRSDTAGAEILSCKVKLYYRHWYKNSGGTAIIGTHGYDSRPSTWSNGSVKQDRVRSSGWPKPGSRTVNLGTTIGNEFRTGSAKGIALGPGPSSSTTYYGEARGAGSGSLTPVLYITYRK